MAIRTASRNLARRLWKTGADPRTMVDMRRDIQGTGFPHVVTDALCMAVDDGMAEICAQQFPGKVCRLLRDRPDGKGKGP